MAGASGLERHAVQIDTEPVWVDADSDRLIQVVTNLLGNALPRRVQRAAGQDSRRDRLTRPNYRCCCASFFLESDRIIAQCRFATLGLGMPQHARCSGSDKVA
jgi:hypothetical protein